MVRRLKTIKYKYAYAEPGIYRVQYPQPEILGADNSGMPVSGN